MSIAGLNKNITEEHQVGDKSVLHMGDLTGLPADTRSHIAQQLPTKSLWRLGQTSRQFSLELNQANYDLDFYKTAQTNLQSARETATQARLQGPDGMARYRDYYRLTLIGSLQNMVVAEEALKPWVQRSAEYFEGEGVSGPH